MVPSRPNGSRLPPLTALIAFLAFLAPVLGATGLEAQSRETLSLEMFLETQSVSDPQISPDGRQVVYTRGWIDALEDRRESSIWVMNADGARARHLVDGSSAVWSPDGTRIAYLAPGEPRGSQIWIRWMDQEGATSQVTRLERSPSNIRWSPDGERIAFTMVVPDRDEWSVQLPPRPEGARWTTGPKIVDRVRYRRDREGYVDEGYTQIFVVSADGGAPRQVTDGDWNHSSPEWTADGRTIVFQSLRVEDSDLQWRESHIYDVDVANGSIRQLTSRRGPFGSPVPSPDGRHIAFQGYDWSDDAYRENDLYVMNADGSNVRSIARELGRSLGNVTWARDGSGVYFNSSILGTQNVWFAPLQGEPRQVTEGVHMLGMSSRSETGRGVGTLSSFHQPGDVVSFSLAGGENIERITRVNDDLLEGVQLGEVEEIWYRSVDEWDIHGWIIKPPNFDPSRRYPLMLAIHGGPHGMYNVGFNFGWQEHAANGYVILYTNPRGSAGYGSEFGNLINNAYPDNDFHDLMAAVDSVVERGYIDQQRMFVYGCSGGGVLTAWVVGHTDRFAAASSNCPVTNWLSFVGTTDGVGWYRNFERFPWDDPSEHLRRSPIMYVGNVTTPTMLMTGENDLRTPMGQTEEYYQALKVLGVPSVMLRFQDEWHGTGRNPSNFMRTQLYLRSWFEQWGGARAADDSGL